MPMDKDAIAGLENVDFPPIEETEHNDRHKHVLPDGNVLEYIYRKNHGWIPSGIMPPEEAKNKVQHPQMNRTTISHSLPEARDEVVKRLTELNIESNNKLQFIMDEWYDWAMDQGYDSSHVLGEDGCIMFPDGDWISPTTKPRFEND